MTNLYWSQDYYIKGRKFNNHPKGPPTMRYDSSLFERLMSADNIHKNLIPKLKQLADELDLVDFRLYLNQIRPHLRIFFDRYFKRDAKSTPFAATIGFNSKLTGVTLPTLDKRVWNYEMNPLRNISTGGLSHPTMDYVNAKAVQYLHQQIISTQVIAAIDLDRKLTRPKNKINPPLFIVKERRNKQIANAVQPQYTAIKYNRIPHHLKDSMIPSSRTPLMANGGR